MSVNNNISNNINVLIDFASQIQFKNHGYITMDDNGLAQINYGKRDWNQFTNFINILKETPVTKQEDLRKLETVYKIIENHLTRKITGFSRILVKQKDKERIASFIHELHAEREKITQTIDLNREGLKPIHPLTEDEARINFYRDLPKHLSVKHAANLNELNALKAISKRIWEANPTKYPQIMLDIYRGEHVLIEEDSQTAEKRQFTNYNQLKTFGAHLRGSSHYDGGWTKEGRLPKSEEEVENPQFEIWGDHVKELVFGRVKMAVIDEKLIYGKTYEQAIKAMSKQNPAHPGLKTVKARYFTWFQLEGARDSNKFYKKDFWAHRTRDYPTYVFRKYSRFERANIGPYGYGHGDYQPTVISRLPK